MDACGGEIRDDEQEIIINELKLEAEQWKLKYEQVKTENKTLANELYDTQYRLNVYEQPVTNNKDDNE
jgi:hypothetical protein